MIEVDWVHYACSCGYRYETPWEMDHLPVCGICGNRMKMQAPCNATPPADYPE